MENYFIIIITATLAHTNASSTGLGGIGSPDCLGRWALVRWSSHPYTLGAALRNPDVKKIGEDLAPEALRKSPWYPRPRRPENLWDFGPPKIPNPCKNRALRALRTVGVTIKIVVLGP